MTDLTRAWPWLAVAVATTALVAVIAPQQVGVLFWSLTKLTWGAWLGYWVDRTLFPYSRPHTCAPVGFESECTDGHGRPKLWETPPPSYLPQIRRAVIVGAVVVALGLGV